jgi:hypothetical protein
MVPVASGRVNAIGAVDGLTATLAATGRGKESSLLPIVVPSY